MTESFGRVCRKLYTYLVSFSLFRSYAPINVKPVGVGGGRRGIGRGFDRSLLPVGRTFELSCCPGGGIFEYFANI